MKNKNIIFFIITLPIIFLINCGSSISDKDKTEILAVVDGIFVATHTKDIDALMSHLSKDFIMDVYIKSKKHKRHTYASYKIYLKKIFSSMSNYNHKIFNEKFSNLNKNTYIYSFYIKEEYTSKNKHHTQTHPETWHLIRKENNFVVIKILIYH